ncbi:DUF2913 family protein [Shewanella sp. UCD-KL21]|uniref:DUF2913 family protein n=1 Tax=Shewanella sp. UCD-KL21 TaxID=1917164 RepID=UPI000970AB44|nr:DUF2913 family protein [Shewanella sp. UCD-KL21]
MQNTTQAPTYNQAILAVAEAGIKALQESALKQKAKRTPAQESHFLCAWMVESLRDKRFPKMVADDLNSWIRMARSQGAGAMLPQLLQRIAIQYQQVLTTTLSEKGAIDALIEHLDSNEWFVITDTAFSDSGAKKLKLAGNGQSSMVICEHQLSHYFDVDRLIKPLAIYVRGDEQYFAEQALNKGLLVSQGNKKTSLIKHHKTYLVYPNNQLSELCLLVESLA